MSIHTPAAAYLCSFDAEWQCVEGFAALGGDGPRAREHHFVLQLVEGSVSEELVDGSVSEHV